METGSTLASATCQITWYHHISLFAKVMDEIERVYYIIETAQNGWSRDTMLAQIANSYISRAGKKNSLEKVA